MIDLIRKIEPNDRSNRSVRLDTLVSLSQNLIAFVVELIDIEVLEYGLKNVSSVKLKHHHEKIKCLRFSTNSALLCSCSIDHILIWKMSDVMNGQINDAKILKRNLEFEPSQCSFHSSDKTVAICYGDNLSILQVEVI